MHFMTTTLLIVRHGQTAWNKDLHFRGRTDLLLDDTGLQQAEAVARRIAASYRPVAILASPLQRARQTAEAIARAVNLPVQAEEDLIDIDYGEFTGLSPAEAEAKFQEFYRAWLNVPHTVRFPQGESLDDVRHRLTTLVRRMTELYPAGQVVLVTHQIVCQVFVCTLLGIHNGYLSHFQIDTASLTVFEVNGSRATLITANDTCHLEPLAGS
jgi:probable phosphoglycerate mutase